MSGFARWMQSVALSFGAVGLFFVAFLDSSFLSLPEINDLLLVWMVTRHKERMILYSAATTLGSLVGCLTLYSVGRKGGAALARRRFGSEHVDRAVSTFQRYGVMAVLIPSLLPPPAPFKIFVILSGVAGISLSRFVVAISVGRGVRYFGEGALAVRYGDQAMALIHQQGRTVALVLAMLAAVGLAGYVVWRKSRARSVR